MRPPGGDDSDELANARRRAEARQLAASRFARRQASKEERAATGAAAGALVPGLIAALKAINAGVAEKLGRPAGPGDIVNVGAIVEMVQLAMVEALSVAAVGSESVGVDEINPRDVDGETAAMLAGNPEWSIADIARAIADGPLPVGERQADGKNYTRAKRAREDERARLIKRIANLSMLLADARRPIPEDVRRKITDALGEARACLARIPHAPRRSANRATPRRPRRRP